MKNRFLTIILVSIVIMMTAGCSQNEKQMSAVRNGSKQEAANPDTQYNNKVAPTAKETNQYSIDFSTKPQVENTTKPQYKKYVNGRYGFSIHYPQDFTSGRPPANGDGMIWNSPDGQTELRAYGSNNVVNESLVEKYNREIKDIHVNIAYKTRGDNWFVISWNENGKIIYKKVFVGQEATNTMVFSYPASQKEKYNLITSALEESFKPGNINIAH